MTLARRVVLQFAATLPFFAAKPKLRNNNVYRDRY
jgi:hypothetical protein